MGSVFGEQSDGQPRLVYGDRFVRGGWGPRGEPRRVDRRELYAGPAVIGLDRFQCSGGLDAEMTTIRQVAINLRLSASGRSDLPPLLRAISYLKERLRVEGNRDVAGIRSECGTPGWNAA